MAALDQGQGSSLDEHLLDVTTPQTKPTTNKAMPLATSYAHLVQAKCTATLQSDLSDKE